MPKLNAYIPYTIVAAGGTKSFDLAESADLYLVAPSAPVTLLADMIFSTTGTEVESMQFNIIYGGNVTSNTGAGKTVSFFGTDLTDAQALTQLIITATWTNTAWSVGVVPYSIWFEKSIHGYQIEDATIDTAAIADGKVTLAKQAALSGSGYLTRGGAAGVVEEFLANTTGYLVLGDGTDVTSVAMTGDISITGAGVTAIELNKVLTAMILDANVTVAKVEASLKLEQTVVYTSFETGELGAYKIRMPYAGSITNVYAEAVKAIAATDSGTVVLKNNAGTTMTVTTPIVFAASDAFGTAYSSAVTANNTFVAGDIITILTAKTTAGGKALVTLQILRS